MIGPIVGDCSLPYLLHLEAKCLEEQFKTTAHTTLSDSRLWQIEIADIGDSTPLRIVVGEFYPLTAPVAVLVPDAASHGSGWAPLFNAARDWRPGDDLGRIVAAARHRLGL